MYNELSVYLLHLPRSVQCFLWVWKWIHRRLVFTGCLIHCASSVATLSWSRCQWVWSLSQEHGALGRNTPWTGRRKQCCTMQKCFAALPSLLDIRRPWKGSFYFLVQMRANKPFLVHKETNVHTHRVENASARISSFNYHAKLNVLLIPTHCCYTLMSHVMHKVENVDTPQFIYS